MAGLFHTLGIGAESLFTARQGVDTTGHNIANAQTEGYSRQRVQVSQRDPSSSRGGIIIGNGVYVGNINRVHDKFIEKQYNLSQQDAGLSEKLYDSLKNISQIYSPEHNASISDEMTKFFNSLQDLSSFPDDMTARTAVRENAVNLINSFKKIDADLGGNQLHLNESVNHISKEASDILRSVANLNAKINNLEAGNKSEANDLRDQRDQLITQLSNYIDVNYYEDEHGMFTIRGPGDVLLVEGKNFQQIVTQRSGETGLLNVFLMDENQNMRDITSKVEKGQLSSVLHLRDTYLPELKKANDEMVSAFVSEFNQVHRSGFGLNDFAETQGRDFFKPVVDVKDAAKNMSLSDDVSLSTDAISAAFTANAPGDNVILNRLVTIKDKKLLNGGNTDLTEYYANLVGSVGLEVVRAENLKNADEITLSDVKSRKDAVSGVSMDEESTNLLKWQSTFTASSKLITTVDEMLETVLSLKR